MTGTHHIEGFPRLGLCCAIFAAIILITTAFTCYSRLQYAEQVQTPTVKYLMPGIVIQGHIDTCVRQYHVRPQLTYISTPETMPVLRESDTIPVRVWAFRNSLFSITGITDVTIYPYSFKVTIGRAFTWEEIEPKMIDKIRKQYMWLTGEEK